MNNAFVYLPISEVYLNMDLVMFVHRPDRVTVKVELVNDKQLIVYKNEDADAIIRYVMGYNE